MFSKKTLSNIKYELRRLKSERGFSMFEVLIAMFILFMIVMAFTPFLLASIGNIHFAGDKSEALYEGQSEIEVSIAEKDTEEGSKELAFEFDGATITVRGGIVDVLKTKPESEASAWLSGFVPYIPSIEADPSLLVEGYNELSVEVVLTDAPSDNAFDELAVDTITIYDHNGQKIHELPYDICENTDQQCAEFILPEGLSNSRSPYMITLILEVYDEELEEYIEIYLETRLQIAMPYAVTAGSGQDLYKSPDARDIWKNKSHDAIGSGTFRDIIWTGYEYVAVANTGRIVYWKNRQEPKRVSGFDDAPALNAISVGADGWLIAVGDAGHVVTTDSVDEWDEGDLLKVNEADDNDLRAIHWNESEGKFFTVGSGGKILSSIDNGLSWTEIIEWADEDGDNVTFEGVAYGDSCWLAVGRQSDEEAVIYKSTGGSWEKVENLPGEIADKGLNDVIYDDSSYTVGDQTYDHNRFIVVGDNGAMLALTSDNGWEDLNVEIWDSGTTATLNAIDWAQFYSDRGHYIAAGENGTITTWTGLGTDSWVQVDPGSPGIDENINGVAIRWTP